MEINGRPTFILSEQTASLVKILRGVNRDIADDALSAAVGFQVNGSTPAVRSALRILESTESVVFERVRGKGWRRLADSEKVASTARHARTISRTARRGRKRLGTVEQFSELSNADQLQATLRATQFEFAHRAVSTKQLPAPVTASGSDLTSLLKSLKAG